MTTVAMRSERDDEKKHASSMQLSWQPAGHTEEANGSTRRLWLIWRSRFVWKDDGRKINNL